MLICEGRLQYPFIHFPFNKYQDESENVRSYSLNIATDVGPRSHTPVHSKLVEIKLARASSGVLNLRIDT